jgi:hypothetical protein
MEHAFDDAEGVLDAAVDLRLDTVTLRSAVGARNTPYLPGS